MPINLSDVKAFIIKNIYEVKSLKEVSARLNVPQETLRKEFLRREHRHISDFILAQRIEAMKRLLAETNLQCLEVCDLFKLREDSGDTTFKKAVGMTMGEYRVAHHRMKGRNDTVRPRTKHLNPDTVAVDQPNGESGQTTAAVAASSNGSHDRMSKGSGKGIPSEGKILPIVHAGNLYRKSKPQK